MRFWLGSFWLSRFLLGGGEEEQEEEEEEEEEEESVEWGICTMMREMRCCAARNGCPILLSLERRWCSSSIHCWPSCLALTASGNCWATDVGKICEWLIENVVVMRELYAMVYPLYVVCRQAAKRGSGNRRCKWERRWKDNDYVACSWGGGWAQIVCSDPSCPLIAKENWEWKSSGEESDTWVQDEKGHGK